MKGWDEHEFLKASLQRAIARKTLRGSLGIQDADPMKHVYVAGPYRGKHRWIVHQNIQRAEACGFQIAEMGAIPIIPHTMFSAFDGTLSDEFWLEATLSIMRKCDAVFMLPGWRSSEGANSEFREAKILKIPVFDDLGWLQVWILTR